MKNLFFWLCFAPTVAVSLISCKGEKPAPPPPTPEQEAQKAMTPEEKLQSDVNTKIQAELKSAKKTTGIIAGFDFGMSTQDVENHTMKMTGKKILRRIAKGKNKVEYVYQFPLKSGKTDVYIDMAFKDGGLSKSFCVLKGPKKASTADLLKEVKDVLTQWYGAHAFQLSVFNGCERYLWIDGIRHVDLKCATDGVSFVYTDLRDEMPEPIGPSSSGPQIEIKDVSSK